MSRFVQKGEVIDYKNEGQNIIPAGEVIQFGDSAGVVVTDIAPSKVGVLSLTGVYAFDKTEQTEVAFGAKVYKNTTSGKFSTTASGGFFVGLAVKKAKTTDTEILVRIG